MPEIEPSFKEKGYYEMTFPGRNGPRTVQMTRQDFIDGCEFPTPAYVKRVPSSVQMFIAHGTADAIVPMIDSADFVNVLTAQPTRRPGTVQLNLLEGCDHNYLGKHREVLIERVMRWLALCQATEVAPPPTPAWVNHGPPSGRGALIVVEGLDRAGKSTQVDRLVQTLHARLVKFPDRTTQIGGMINAYLTNASDIPDEAIHLLFSANRWEVIDPIMQTLATGQSVVCDRYAFSGIAYSRAKGLDLTWCLSPDVGIPMPDVTIFLDLDEATAASRSAYGDERYEKQAFQRVVRETFLDVEHLVQQSGGAWVRLDASGTPDEVYAEVLPLLEVMGARIVHCGAAGLGQAAKICNNMVLGVTQIAVAEAFVLGERLGLQHQALYDVMSKASGQCWSLTTNCPVPGPVPGSPANRDFQPGFAGALMAKDLGLALAALDEQDVAADLGRLAQAKYAEYAAGEGAARDFSGIIEDIRASHTDRSEA